MMEIYPIILVSHRDKFKVHSSFALAVANCATGASYKREDGIVLVDSEACIGCGTCREVCPYDVRRLNPEQLDYVVDFPLGDFDAPVHVPNTTSKCTFCANRIDREEMPACMELCPGRARYWGDIDDPASEISKFLEGKTPEVLDPEAGTSPNLYFVRTRSRG